MASYQAKGRDPFFETHTSQALEKRGRELAGIGLVALAIAFGAMLFSYTPEDPSWISATDAPIGNWLGRPGAYIAAPLFLILGLSCWAMPFALLVWGLRLILQETVRRAFLSLCLVPVWVLFCAVYAAGLEQGRGWGHDFGLGGLFGDMMMGSLLTLLPLSLATGLKLMQFVLGVAIITGGAFVLGATRFELRAAARFLLVGLVMAYAWLVRLLGLAINGVIFLVEWALSGKDAHSLPAATMPETARVRRPDLPQMTPVTASPGIPEIRQPVPPLPQGAALPQEAVSEKQGFMSLMPSMPSLMRRSEAEHDASLIETPPPQAGDEARLKARITKAIQSRQGIQADETPALNHAPDKPLTKGRGHGPLPLIFNAFRRNPAENPARQEPVIETIPALPPLPLAAEKPAPFPSIPVPEPARIVQPPVQKPIRLSTRARAEAQPSLQFDESVIAYELPPLNLLMSSERIERHHLPDEALEENARMLENVLDDYGVKGEITSVRPGPVVTLYELEPAPGLKASRVIGLADDIARSMSALSARVSTMPGRSVIGIELPNEQREMVGFREILSSRDYGDGRQALPLALGKDIGGDPIVADLAKMPHLLIAGTTGSGKSVAINTMILSLLYKLTPDECRLIMIDPKMLELSVYDGIPHLLSPVVTDPKKAVVALKWVVGEMEDRYRKMSKMGVRNIDGYNSRVADALARNEMFERTVQTGFDDESGEPIFETEQIEPRKIPYIVVIVDEMADLMMVAGKEIEACIQRLAQMARASGIHLIMATQRPSVDVITGTIKANFPTRISFQVTSKIDSRTILGEMGAEQLLGQGDMLYMAGGAKITRCHGPFVSDGEVEEIVNHLKAFGSPDYVSGVVQGPDDDKAEGIDAVLGLNTGGNTGNEDALYDQAVAIVAQDRKCSTSYIQRKLGIGYNKAARLVEQMEQQGIVTPANHVGKREILIPEQA